MAIIVSKHHKDARKLDPTSFSLESDMQAYIHNNPAAIPLYDIDSDIKLFVAAREFSTKSGPIDALAFDQHGTIYVVETKLYRNHDKRTVVAQALDYGASLWRHATDFDAFIETLDKHTSKQFNQTFSKKFAEFFELDDVTDALITMRDNLNSGSIKFVILMDSLHSQLKDLIVYVNQNSQFDIYAVELEYYQHDEFEIIIPKLFGDEVKKEVVSKKQTSGYTYNDIDAAQFKQYITTNDQLTPVGQQTLIDLHDLYEQLIKQHGGTCFYYYSPKAKRAGFGINDADGKQAGLITTNGEMWSYQRNKTGEIAQYNKRILYRLIDEGLFKKTDTNLTASAWSIGYVYFTDTQNPGSSHALEQLVAICKKEATL